jgi:predicted ATPase/DNA-binding winged helix-turn-helix (wHTH) protein
LIGLGVLCQTDQQPILDVVAKPVMPAEQVGSSSAIRVVFGPFELNVTDRVLKKADEAIPLGARAFDILIALIDRAGEVVTKNELIASAWPDVTVEEGSLRVHLSALRKALGDGQFSNRYFSNVQGRGYCFVAPVIRRVGKQDKGSGFAGLSNLPPALGRMVGRDNAVREIRLRLQAERLITVLGAGGIGKTTVAVAVGHAASTDFSDGVFFIDLSTVRHKEQVVGAVASAVGLDHQFADPEDSLFKFLRTRKALVIFDSCEHLIEKTAELADGIFRRAPDVCMLATSREALQTAGESVFRLHPLDCPPEQAGLTAIEALSYPAARLFVERVSARGNNFSLGDDEAPVVAEICRKLDGVALAIELAAGRAAIFGIRDTLVRLGSRLDLLKFGRRTANPRHQTLRATLDWSHDHLSELERIVLRRVAILVGWFTLEAALAVAEEQGIGQSDIANAVGGLVDKSLIGSATDYRGIAYRLLDTTRTYALEKLDASGEADCIAARHADFLTRVLESKSVDLFELGGYLGNVRAALEWSFGPGGNDGAAAGLAAAAAQLFLAMSLLSECRTWMERAIGRITTDHDLRHQMEIYASLALSLMFTEGNSERVRSAFQTALAFAERRDDSYQQLRLLSGLSMYFHRTFDAAGSMKLALRGEVVARNTGSPEDGILADSMLGAAHYMLGDQLRAQQHLERALHSAPRFRRFNAAQYLFDSQTTCLFNLTRSHWLTGNLDKAALYAERTIDEAERSDHPIALCRALILTMSVYFWIDDLQQVERNLSRLLITAEKYSLAPYHAVAWGQRGQFLIRAGRTTDGMQHLRDCLEKLRILQYEMLAPDFVADLAVCLAKQNERAEALTLLDDSIAVQIKSKRPLHVPALFLARGLAFASGQVADIPSAELCLQEAMILAEQQSGLSFQLRAGLELARIWIGRGEFQKARDLIRPVYDRFSEGFTTPDLAFAKGILEQASNDR